MAEKRMFAKSIVLTDAFLDMPMSARCLYFTLGMLADDDGFVGSPKSIMRQCGASQDDMNVLISKRFVLAFESGVIVIKHWRINNVLRADRHIPTTYREELAMLSEDQKGAYTEKNKALSTNCQPTVNQVTTNCQPTDTTDKYSIDIGEVSIDKDNLTDTNVSVCRTKDVRQITEAWNSLGLQQLRKVTSDSKRGGMLRARVNEYGTPAVLEAIENVRKSAFLKGQNNHGWVITFDWFVKPNNFVKVLEGNFDDKDIQPTQQPKKKRQYVTGAEYTAPKPTISDAELWDRINSI